MNPTETESRSPSRQALAALAAMGSVYFFSYFLRAAVPGTIFDDLQAELGISAAAVAAMGSMGISVMNGLAYIGCGTIGQAGGLILDRFRGTAHVAASGAVVYPQAAYVALFTFMAVLAALNLLAAWHVPETRGEQQAFHRHNTAGGSGT